PTRSSAPPSPITATPTPPSARCDGLRLPACGETAPAGGRGAARGLRLKAGVLPPHTCPLPRTGRGVRACRPSPSTEIRRLMQLAFFSEQVLNGLQLGVMLFLMAAGLTLIFGVMGLINLAHGSLYMVGAFACAAVAAWTGSFWLGLVASLACAAAAGAIVELLVIRRLYDRDHLDQVLATFALILIFSEGTRWLFGSFPLYLDIPPLLQGAVALPGGAQYPVYRLAIIAAGALVAFGLYVLIGKTRLGMRIRAGESDREMIGALGVDIRTLYTVVFALGAALAGLAGAMV